MSSNADTGEGRGLILDLGDVHTYYGSIHALKGVSLNVGEGEIVTLIGSNGAGKSTTLRSINGLNRPRKGSIVFRGTDITQKPAHEIVKMGIAQAPEGRKLFPRMTVFENLEMGAFQRSDRKEIREDIDRVFTLFPRLAERKTQKAGTMSGGEQQMCAIGRALMARPKLLLLDEPSMGLAPVLVERIFETLVEINEQGTPSVATCSRPAASRSRTTPIFCARTSRCARRTSARPRRVCLNLNPQGEEGRRHEEADARVCACTAAGHLQGRADSSGGHEAELAGGDGVAAPGDEHGPELPERRLAVGPVREGQQRVAVPAFPVPGDRALVGRRLPLRVGEVFRLAAEARRLEDRPVRLLCRVREVAVEAVQEDDRPAVGDREVVAPQAQGEPEPEIGGEERVRPLAGDVGRRPRDADADRVEAALKRRRPRLDRPEQRLRVRDRRRPCVRGGGAQLAPE